MLFFGIILIQSCNTKESISDEEMKKMDLKTFSMMVPKSWENKIFKGIDYSTEYILIENKDTIHIDYGKFKEGFDDVINVFSFEQRKKYDSLGLDTTNLVFSKTPDIDAAQGTFLDEYYFYDTVDNLSVKIRIPKRTGMGYTGVIFDSINTNGERLKIYARNLDEITQSKLIKAFKTIVVK